MTTKFKVTSIAQGCHHMIARCNDCDWGDDYGAGGHTERERVRKATKKHVSETGHTVNVEQGLFWQYFPEEEEPSP